MGIPAQSRWWVFTLLVIGVLVLISMLALDRPDVIWAGTTPECPHCRHVVRAYSHRCADCGGEFDWLVASDEDSPISSSSLSAQEAEWVRDRVKALGPELAAQRVARATDLSLEAATRYLETVGQGDCGWCGGTRDDLTLPEAERRDCPACFGTGDCVDCGGDRRVRFGDARASRAYARYRRELVDILASKVPVERKREAAERLARTFLASHEGTVEARGIAFWPAILPSGSERVDPLAVVGNPDTTIVATQRGRLDKILLALVADAN